MPQSPVLGYQDSGSQLWFMSSPSSPTDYREQQEHLSWDSLLDLIQEAGPHTQPSSLLPGPPSEECTGSILTIASDLHP